MNKKKKTKQANTGGVNKDCPCILFTSLSVADRQSLSHIFVKTRMSVGCVYHCTTCTLAISHAQRQQETQQPLRLYHRPLLNDITPSDQ